MKTNSPTKTERPASKPVPSKETLQVLAWIRSEITAGGSLGFDAESKIWNNATLRAAAVVQRYAEGKGIFQMGDSPASPTTPAAPRQEPPQEGGTTALKENLLKLCHLIEALPASTQQTEISIQASKCYNLCADEVQRIRDRPGKYWGCANFKASEEDPAFCANCAGLASMHKGPTPGAPRSFRL